MTLVHVVSRRQPSSRFLSAFHSLATLTHYAAQRSRPKGVGGRVASVGSGEGARRPKGEAAGRFRLGAKAAGSERRNGERREPGVASRVSHGSVPKASEGNRERVTAPRETRRDCYRWPGFYCHRNRTRSTINAVGIRKETRHYYEEMRDK